VGNFRYEWNDFSGGYYVGPSAINQPKNTWTGTNVVLTDDDASVVPTNAVYEYTLTGTDTTGGYIQAPGTVVSQTLGTPTYFNNTIIIPFIEYLAVGNPSGCLYLIDAVTQIVTKVTVVTASAASFGFSPYEPVCVKVDGTSATDFYIYVTFGGSSYYRVRKSTLAITTVTPSGGAAMTSISGLTVWGARLILWSMSDDRIIFSNALDFTTVSSENYVQIGYSEDRVIRVLSRQFDLIVCKQGGFYSVTGVLGTSTAVRQLNDTTGFAPDRGALALQFNNTVYFLDIPGAGPYANLYQLSGTRIDPAAFIRFNSQDTNPINIAKSNSSMVISTVDNELLLANNQYKIFVANKLNRWHQITGTRFLPEAGGAINIYCATSPSARSSRNNVAYDDLIYIVEHDFDGKKIAVAAYWPNTVYPGGTNALLSLVGNRSTGTLILEDVKTTEPTKITSVWVEAELLQINQSTFTGNASITCTVNNNSQDWTDFNGSATTPSSTSGTFTAAFNTFPNQNDWQSKIGVIKFNTDSMGYGYANEISFTFAGLKIRRVWAEGTTR
jgi:hypothetical protein